MSADRLDSWREVARYLNRAVRTVQRWENSQGLPVYRHVREQLSAVYAYPAELDAWWQERKLNLATREKSSALRNAGTSASTLWLLQFATEVLWSFASL
jgi:hypothetical protein